MDEIVRRYEYNFRSDSIDDLFATIFKEARRVKEIDEKVCIVPMSWLMGFAPGSQLVPSLAWHRDQLVIEAGGYLMGDRLRAGLIEGQDYITISASFKDDLYKVSAKQFGYGFQSDAEFAVGILIRTIRNVGTIDHPKPRIVLNEIVDVMVGQWANISVPPTKYAFNYRRPWSEKIKSIADSTFGAIPFRLWICKTRPTTDPITYILTKDTDMAIDDLFYINPIEGIPNNFPIRRMTEDIIGQYNDMHLISFDQLNQLMEDYLKLLAENRATPLRLVMDTRPNVLTRQYPFRQGDMFDLKDPITNQWKEVIVGEFVGSPQITHFAYHEIQLFCPRGIGNTLKRNFFDLNYLEHSLAPLHKYTEDRTKWSNGSLILVCGSGGFVAGERELHFSPGIVVENQFERNDVLVRFYTDHANALGPWEQVNLPANAEVEEKWFDLYSPFIRPIDRNLPLARKQWILTLFQPPYRYKQLVEHREEEEEDMENDEDVSKVNENLSSDEEEYGENENDEDAGDSNSDGSLTLKKRKRVKKQDYEDDDGDEDGDDNDDNSYDEQEERDDDDLDQGDEGTDENEEEAPSEEDNSDKEADGSDGDSDESVILKKRKRVDDYRDEDDNDDHASSDCDEEEEEDEDDHHLRSTTKKKQRSDDSDLTLSSISKILKNQVKSLGTGNDCDVLKGILLNILPVIDKKKDSIREIELKKKNLKEKESLDECVFCLSAKKNIVFIPCGHLCVCEGCSVDIHQCPMCRTKCIKKQKVFS